MKHKRRKKRASTSVSPQPWQTEQDYLKRKVNFPVIRGGTRDVLKSLKQAEKYNKEKDHER